MKVEEIKEKAEELAVFFDSSMARVMLRAWINYPGIDDMDAVRIINEATEILIRRWQLE